VILGFVSIVLGAPWLWLALRVFAPIRTLDPRLQVRFQGLPAAVGDDVFALSIGLVLIVAGLGLLHARSKSRDEEV
jgi:hypothetical protein